MEMTGFTETQMTVREAVSQLCARFPNTYWQDHDQQEKDPKSFRRSFMLAPLSTFVFACSSVVDRQLQFID